MAGMRVVSFDDTLPIVSELRWLYVDFNSYFASVEQQLRPELRGRPIAIVPVETDATCAIAASYEAKAFGIKTGTPIYEAREKCPGLMAAEALQPELFGGLAEAEMKQRTRFELVSRVLDKINHRFGRDSVLVGMLPSQGRSFSGTKIAFTRIPDVEEFLE